MQSGMTTRYVAAKRAAIANSLWRYRYAVIARSNIRKGKAVSPGYFLKAQDTCPKPLAGIPLDVRNWDVSRTKQYVFAVGVDKATRQS